MTRITNFGRKRTYVQAGFVESATLHESPGDKHAKPTARDVPEDPADGPVKKRRRRSKKPAATSGQGDTNENAPSGSHDIAEGQVGSSDLKGESAVKEATKKKTHKEKKFEKGRSVNKKFAQLRLNRSEGRRQQRISQKFQDTTCFACRQKGHAAKDCPETKADGTEQKESGKVVGICYRCGSTRHNLSRCKEPEDPLMPLPFASCFVCSSKGHLASSCPKNVDRGVYPNGGCCKLCGDTTHLAKNCELRKGDKKMSTSAVGLSRNVGADEDDFHVLKRRTAEVDKDEKRVEKIKRAAVDGVGVQSGVKVPGASKPSVPKKVVYF